MYVNDEVLYHSITCTDAYIQMYDFFMYMYIRDVHKSFKCQWYGGLNRHCTLCSFHTFLYTDRLVVNLKH